MEPGRQKGKAARRPRVRLRTIVLLPASVIILWIGASYLVLPRWWQSREADHPALKQALKLTTTPSGQPGDPLNLFLISPEEDLAIAMAKSGWYPADPVTFRTSLRIVEDSALHRPYRDAPVSTLMLFGRRQDLAFEKPVGNDPRERHHVRLWKAPLADGQGRAAWWAAATFDRSVGFSHTTGQVTHHIAPEVDAERDLILRDLQAGGLFEVSYKAGFQSRSGSNGGGDPWRSDGKLGVAEAVEPLD